MIRHSIRWKWTTEVFLRNIPVKIEFVELKIKNFTLKMNVYIFHGSNVPKSIDF